MVQKWRDFSWENAGGNTKPWQLAVAHLKDCTSFLRWLQVPHLQAQAYYGYGWLVKMWYPTFFNDSFIFKLFNTTQRMTSVVYVVYLTHTQWARSFWSWSLLVCPSREPPRPFFASSFCGIKLLEYDPQLLGGSTWHYMTWYDIEIYRIEILYA
jgi:hypothetical protein